MGIDTSFNYKGYDSSLGFIDGTLTQDGINANVTGKLIKQPDANSTYGFGFTSWTSEGYYIPITWNGLKPGWAIKRLRTQEIFVCAPDSTSITILCPVIKAAAQMEFALYRSKSDAEANKDGQRFYVNCTKCEFLNQAPPESPIEGAEIGAGTTLVDYNADDGFTGSVQESYNSYLVSGTFTKQESANKLFPQNEQTGFYLPITLRGQTGQAIKRTSNNKILVFGETDDTPTTMKLVLYVDQSAPKIEMKLYENKENATTDTGGKVFYIDCSRCSFDS